MVILDLLRKTPLTVVIAVLALLCHATDALLPWFEIHLQEPVWSNPISVLGCHLLHWSTEHLCWDLAVFGLLPDFDCWFMAHKTRASFNVLEVLA